LGKKKGDFAPKLRPNLPIAQNISAMGAAPKSCSDLGAIGCNSALRESVEKFIQKVTINFSSRLFA
jgi:hypothetical protein